MLVSMYSAFRWGVDEQNIQEFIPEASKDVSLLPSSA